MQCTRRRGVLLAICLLLVSAFSAPSFAKFIPKVEAKSGDGSAYLMVNGHQCIEFKKPNGNLSPGERAKIVADKLSAALENGATLGELTTEPTGNNTKVQMGDTVLAIATVAEGKARGMSTADLADMWVANLRKLLSLPPLSVAPTSLVVPVGETRTAAVECLLDGPMNAEIADSSIVSVDGKSRPGTLIFTGLAMGETKVSVKCGEYSVPMDVAVRKYAAYAASEPLKAIVTGRDAPADMVARAARDAARRGVNIETGARLQTVELASPVSALPEGKSVRVPVKVEASGLDYIPAEITVPVEVDNDCMPSVETSWIMYSNNPERIAKYQTLFGGRMSGVGQGVRLLYHHQNAMKTSVGFVIDILNTTDKPASVHVIEGVSEPMVDTVLVGYRAGRDFMDNQRTCIGRVLELAPGTRRVLVSQELGYNRTASGIMELRQLSGDPMMVRVVAKPEVLRAEEDPMGIEIRALTAETILTNVSDHIYPKPLLRMEAKYTAGKPWTFIRLGKNALKHATRNMKLDGNYGVTHTISIAMENPLSTPQTVELVFEATAGPTSGVFFIDGKESRVRFLVATREQELCRTTLAPGQSKTMSIITMPLSGSAYPATLILRPTGTTGALMN